MKKVQKTLLIGFNEEGNRMVSQSDDFDILLPSIEWILRSQVENTDNIFNNYSTACLASDYRLYCPSVPYSEDLKDKTTDITGAGEELTKGIMTNLFRLWENSNSKKLIIFCPKNYTSSMNPKTEIFLNRRLPERIQKVISSEVFRNIFNLPVDLGISRLEDEDAFLEKLEMSPRLKNDPFDWLKRESTSTMLSNFKSSKVYRYGSETAFENAIVINLAKPDKTIYLFPHPSGPEEIEPVLNSLHVDRIKNEETRIKERITAEYRNRNEFPIIGESKNLTPIYRQLLLAAKGKDKHVLVLGETGSGKELAAEVLHFITPQRRNPRKYRTLNCASFIGSDPRISNTALFGCVKGAYTGAVESTGLIPEVDGGTLFLDEVQALPHETLQLLLRFMEDGRYSKVGKATQESKRMDVRIIAATNQGSIITDKKWVDSGFLPRFGFIITMPPLRYRRGDIPILARHFFETAKNQKKEEIPEGIDVYTEFNNMLPRWQSDPWVNSNVRGLKRYVENWLDNLLLNNDLKSPKSDSEEKKQGRRVIFRDKEALYELIMKAKDLKDLEKKYSDYSDYSEYKNIYGTVRSAIYRNVDDNSEKEALLEKINALKNK